jgi:molecular chaperone DnaK (HSP70)
MSVVGIDLGTVNSVIAVARNRGVDVVSIPADTHLFFCYYAC